MQNYEIETSFVKEYSTQEEKGMSDEVLGMSEEWRAEEYVI